MDTAAPAHAPEQRTVSLWRHRDFLYLWAGQSSSMLGSAISFIALPLVAVLVLNLDAFHIGVLATAGTLPALIVGPFIGPAVDRTDRRTLMIIADVGRAVLMTSVPVAYWFGWLRFGQLVVVAAGMGSLTILFTVAHQAYLPSIVDERSLSDGNAKLEASHSFTEVGGPGLAGWLIGLGGPALGVAADAASYVVSVCSLLRIRTVTSVERAGGPRPGFWQNTTSGFRMVWHDPVLRSLSVSYAVLAMFSQIQNAIYMLFLVRWIHLRPTMIAVVFTLSSVVGFGSALMSGRLAGRLGVGRLIVLGQAVMVAGGVLLAAVAGSRVQAAATMLVAEACFASGLSFYGVGSRTLIQSRVAVTNRGRVIGASKVLTGLSTAGAGLIGGGVAALYGSRTAMVVGAVGMTAALALVLRPRVWTAHTGTGEPARPPEVAIPEKAVIPEELGVSP